MAHIERRVSKNGRKTYRVKWRLCGTRTGHPESETFADSGSALTFKLAVEAAGHRWPDNYVQGVGWIEDTQPLAEDSTAGPVLFGDHALRYVRTLSGVDERTRHDYERDLRNRMLDSFGDLDIRDGGPLDRNLVRQWVKGGRHTTHGDRNTDLDRWAELHLQLREHLDARPAPAGSGMDCSPCRPYGRPVGCWAPCRYPLPDAPRCAATEAASGTLPVDLFRQRDTRAECG